MIDEVKCPACFKALRRSDDLEPGQLVSCPHCATTFSLNEKDPDPAPAPPRPADFAVQRDPGREIRPDDFRRRDDFRADTRRDVSPVEQLPTDFPVRLADWWETAKAHYTEYMGPAIGYQVVSQVISLAVGLVPYLGAVIQAAINPALDAGMTIVALKQLRGRRWGFGDFFSGFQTWWPLVANSLLFGLIALACMTPAIVVFIAGGVSGLAPLMIAAAVVAVLGLVPMTYLSIRGFFFAVPLIVDRGFGPVEAIQGSWRMTQDKFWDFFKLGAILFGLNLLGLLLLCIGLLFTVPLATLLKAAAYADAEGSDPPLPRPRDHFDRRGDSLDRRADSWRDDARWDEGRRDQFRRKDDSY
jgi:uncharacterized membrane protein